MIIIEIKESMHKESPNQNEGAAFEGEDSKGDTQSFKALPRREIVMHRPKGRAMLD